MIDSKLARGVSIGAKAALVTGCGHLPIIGPAFEDMAEKRAGMPGDWTVTPMTGDTSQIISDYSVFGDAQLLALIQEAMENNRSLRAAQESVRISEAALKQTRAGLWPSLRAALGVDATDGGPTDANLEDESYSFSVTGGYSFDIMGDLSASIKSSTAGLRSTEVTYELARRNLAASVARLYFAVIEQSQQLELDRQTITRQRDTFRITETRFEAGSVARDDLVLGEASLASAEDAILQSEASYRAAIRSLEIALGRFPQNQLQVTGSLPAPPPAPAMGVPEMTIRSRPDVVAAELNLIQSFASERIAKLSRWPQLNADFGAALLNTALNDDTGELFDFDNIAFNVGASLAQTIFDGGATSGRIESAEAQKRRALEQYGQTIIEAYGNIVGAIDQFNTLESRARAAAASAEANREVLRLAELRYNEGSQNLLDLIQVRERSDNAESALLSNQRARLEQWIALHSALGGNPLQASQLPTEENTARELLP
jgi:NodT family efflux transporter outer membrane factor (OMF) lipoprotein